MGFSCTQAALRTLQAVKHIHGAGIPASNEIRLDSGALAFFERTGVDVEGGIRGQIILLNGMRAGGFDINADGTIARFQGIGTRSFKAIQALAADPNFRPTVAVI